MDLKKQLLELFDKIALGLSAILFAVYFGFAFLAESPADKPREQVQAATRKVDELRRLAEANPPRPEPLGYAKEVESVLRGGPAPEALPEWLFHKRPLITVRVKAEQANEPVHLPPADVVANPGLGRIAVSWVDNTKNQFVQIDGYKVYRAEGEPKDWRQIASLDGKAHAHVDKDVKAKTSYYYYVESTASLDRSHPMFKKGKVSELPDAEKVQKSEVVGPVQTKRDTIVEVMSATTKSTPQQIAGGDDHPASAYLKVWRYFEPDGTWLASSPRSYKAGEKVGGEEGFGAKKKDFATDYVLETVVEKEIKRAIAGQERAMKVNVVVLKDAKTGERLETSLEDPDPDLERVKKNPKEGEEEAGAGGGAGGDKGKGK